MNERRTADGGSGPEQRRHGRLRLRLQVRPGAGPWPVGLAGALWTANVSSGGMYLRVPAGQGEKPPAGAELTFEMVFPPGQGRASAPGTMRGRGRVLRADDLPAGAGLALQFTQPLTLAF